MLGSSLVLIFGLILLWRRRVPAYINAFTGQSIALAGVAGATGYFGNEPELYWVAAFLLVLKGAVIPALLRRMRSEEHTSELQSLAYLVCRLLLEKKKKKRQRQVQDTETVMIHEVTTESK